MSGVLDVPGAGCPRVLDVWVLDVPGVRCPRVLDVWVLGVSMLDVPMLDVFEPPPVGPHPHLPQKHTCTCFCRSSRCKESVRCASSSLSTWAKLNDFLFRYVHNMYIEQFYLNKICILFISSVFRLLSIYHNLNSNPIYCFVESGHYRPFNEEVLKSSLVRLSAWLGMKTAKNKEEK